MFPGTTPYYSITASSSKCLKQTSHQSKPKMKPMALLWVQYHKANTSVFVLFLQFQMANSFLVILFWMQSEIIINEAICFDFVVLSSFFSFFYRKHLPQTHLGRLEGESLLSLHSTLCVFYRTGISMQDQTLWNCFHNQQNTDIVHLLVKCCSATSRTRSHWQILAMLLWWGKVMLNL